MTKEELQKALANNYETDYGMLTKNQIDASTYYQWYGLMSQLYDEVNGLYIELGKIDDVERKVRDEVIYEIIRAIFDFLGEVNGFVLQQHDFVNTLLVYIMLCKKNNKPKDFFMLKVERHIGRQIVVQNLKSHKILVEEEIEQDLRRKMRNKFRRIKKRNQEKDVTNNNEYIHIDFANFVVRAYAFNCVLHHETEQIKAQVGVVLKNGTVIYKLVTAAYCRVCNCYFLLEHDYQELKKFGVLLCQVITEEQFCQNGLFIKDDGELKAESLLHQSGYNVSAADDLSSQQRQEILRHVVDSNLYSVSGICSHLDWLIARNERVTNRDMSLAIAKWSEDRKYISTYQMNETRTIGIKTITRYGN